MTKPLDQESAALLQLIKCKTCYSLKESAKFYRDEFSICKSCWAKYLQDTNPQQEEPAAATTMRKVANQ